MRPLLSTEKKSRTFPLWAECLLVLAALGMALVEGLHGQWIWAMIFGVCGAACGISVGVRMLSGDKHGGT